MNTLPCRLSETPQAVSWGNPFATLFWWRAPHVRIPWRIVVATLDFPITPLSPQSLAYINLSDPWPWDVVDDDSIRTLALRRRRGEWLNA